MAKKIVKGTLLIIILITILKLLPIGLKFFSEETQKELNPFTHDPQESGFVSFINPDK